VAVRLFQPFPQYRSPVHVPAEDRVECPVPVYFLRYRYPHHAAASGYDRLCDYVGETIELGRPLYWLGETLLRPVGLALARFGGRFEYSRYDFVMELQAIRHFLAHRNSVYHVVYAEKSYRLLAYFAGRNGNRLVGTVHHPPEHAAWLFPSPEPFRRLDLVVVVSQAQQEYWCGVVGEERVRYVPYAVDTRWFVPRPELRDPQRPRCLFIGHHERDFDVLARIVPLLLEANPSLEFTMISRDPRCGEIAASHPRADWRRRVPDAAYRELLQSSHFLVLPLRRSTTCTAVLEALACGTVVVTTRGGISDYLDDQCAIQTPPGDAAAVVEPVNSLLRDRRRWEAMSRAARERALRFSWPATARRMVELYRSLF